MPGVHNRQRTSSPIAKVFVSYSRQDQQIVELLAARLEANDDLEVLRDTSDILPSEEWRNRLAELITVADAVVFCLSPASAISEVCAWEVKRAQALNKRIIPVLIRDVDGNAPEDLTRRHYIYLRDVDDTETGFQKLVMAIQSDIGWIREHTRLGELAERWANKQMPQDLLLQGAQIGEAERWAAAQPQHAPTPTSTTLEYIATSKSAFRSSQQRQRIIVGVSILLLMVMIVGSLVWTYQKAIKEQFLIVTFRPHVINDTAALSALQTFRECPVKNGVLPGCPEMVILPVGSFLMGSAPDKGLDSERPKHRVEIRKRLAVGTRPVTSAEWEQCVWSGVCTAKAGRDASNYAARFVSWRDASQYAAWLSSITGRRYRLLSEAEWEYMARGGQDRIYFWGDDPRSGPSKCEPCEPLGSQNVNPPLLSELPRHPWGVHLYGGVLEWVADDPVPYSPDNSDGTALRDPTRTETSRCSKQPDLPSQCRKQARGGHYSAYPVSFRTAARYSPFEIMEAAEIGFRVARELDE